MKNNKKSILTGSMIAGALIGLSSVGSNAATLSAYSALGSGSEVRSELLSVSKSSAAALELTCGEKKDTKTTEGKSTEGKCGEGKCGEGKKGKEKKGKDKSDKKDEKNPK